MAIGSLAPDSTSNVDLTFSRMEIPCERNKKNTAAESVELIIEANNKAGNHPTSKISLAIGAKITAVKTTPTVANQNAGGKICLYPFVRV